MLRNKHKVLTKEALIVLVILIAIIVSLVLLAPRLSHQPIYRPGEGSKNQSFDLAGYDFLNPQPFSGAKFWIWPKSEKNGCVLYDVNTRTVAGRLYGGNPITLNSDQTQLLCCQRKKSAERKGVMAYLEKTGVLPSRSDLVNYWMIPIRGGKAVHIGQVQELPNGVNVGHTSPNRKFFQIVTTKKDHWIIDLEKAEMLRLDAAKDWSCGWWSDQELIYIEDSTHDIVLFNVGTKRKERIISLNDRVDFYRANNLYPMAPDNDTLLQHWNGSGFSFYLVSYSWTNKNEKGWLIGIDKHTKSLQLIDESFQFQRLGLFNQDRSKYVFCGEAESGDSNAVYVRDLKDSNARTLIPGDPAKSYFSIPIFYNDHILYFQDETIWIMDFEGKNNQRLFPPDSWRSPNSRLDRLH